MPKSILIMIFRIVIKNIQLARRWKVFLTNQNPIFKKHSSIVCWKPVVSKTTFNREKLSSFRSSIEKVWINQ